jgi:hypothetical protein
LTNPFGTLGKNLSNTTSKIVNSSFGEADSYSSGRTSSGVTINVNAPSAIDEVGFTRSVINALNSVERTTGGGASAFQYV